MSLSHQDIVEIQQVQALYGHAVDWPDQSLFPTVFTEDAVFDGRPCGGPDYHEGITAIAAWFGLGKPPHPKAHHAMNVWVYEEAGEVRVKSKWLVKNSDTGAVYLGDYDDVMARTEQGWRIKHRLVTPRDPTAVFEGR